MKSIFKSKEDILAESKILDTALSTSYGYKINKSESTKKWMKLEHPLGDKIIINTEKNLFFNPNNDNDKGDVIQFVCNRINGSTFINVDKTAETFYKALVEINKSFGNHLNTENSNIINDKNNFLEKKEKHQAMQENKWNHIPIKDYNFLTQERNISIDVLKSKYFKDRIFNTYMNMPSGHTMTNTAFGKYINNELVGLEVRNKSIKVVLGDHNGIFYSNTEGMKKIDAVFYAESVIDIASAIEILQANPKFSQDLDYCFVSFSGNLYESKMTNIINDLSNLPISENTKFISLTDNDISKEENKKSGKEYDIMFTAALINKFITPVEQSKNEINFIFKFDKSFEKKTEINKLTSIVEKQNNYIDQNFSLNERFGKYVIFKDNTLNIPRSINLEAVFFNDILKSINGANLYIPHKAKQGNDWNDNLKFIKKKDTDKIIITNNKKENHGISR